MKVYCMMQEREDGSGDELYNIFYDPEYAQECVDLMNEANKTDQYFVQEWHVCQ